MIKFNLLTEGFVQNVPTAGLKSLNAEEIDTLISITGNDATTVVSGEVVNLGMDLGHLHSVDRVRYVFSPISAAGIEIRYGREEGNMTLGALQVGASEVIVDITGSGYTFPRYISLRHAPTSGIVLHSFIVENTDEEIDFGTDGNLTSISLNSPPTAGYSDVVEVPILNSGNLPADIYVSVESAETPVEVFENIELATTPTGIFQAFDPNSFPETIPWEWGHFYKCRVDNDNRLFVYEPNVEEIGSRWHSDRPGSSEEMHWAKDVILQDGRNVFVKFVNNSGWRLILLDVLGQTSFQTGVTLPYSPSTTTHLRGTCFVYDGNDKVYWLRGISSTDGGARELYAYSISAGTISVEGTLPDYNTYWGRQMVYKEGYLYIAGGTSSQQSNTTTGTLFTRYKISDGTTTSLSPLPEAPARSATLKILDNKIYYTCGSTNNEFYVYDIDINLWGTLPPKPFSQQYAFFDIDEKNRTIWTYRADDGGYCSGSNNHAAVLRSYSIDSGVWSSTDLELPCDHWNTSAGGLDEFVIGVQSSIYLYSFRPDTAYITGYIFERPPVTVDDAYWLSPPILIGQTDQAATRVIIKDLIDETHKITHDTNLVTPNFQIRASATSPAGDNYIDNLTSSGVDLDRYVIGTVNGASVDQYEGLRVSHPGTSSEESAAFIYLNEFFGSGGTMQYKFWWHTPSDKAAGSDSNLPTSFYIVPYLDTINTGSTPVRDTESLRRTGGQYIRIILGQETDSGGSFSQIRLWKGNNSGGTNYTIAADPDSKYEIVFILNWETGAYKLRFGGQQIGTGVIALSDLTFLQTIHAVEFYSNSVGTGVTHIEDFSYLTVSRLNLEARTNAAATPLHLDDPLYGINGSLQWFPLTFDSSIFPHEPFIQLKLDFRINADVPQEIVEGIYFAPIVVLSGVEPGETKSAYVRYNFPAFNNLLQQQAYLKAWMTNDKE